MPPTALIVKRGRGRPPKKHRTFGRKNNDGIKDELALLQKETEAPLLGAVLASSDSASFENEGAQNLKDPSARESGAEQNGESEEANDEVKEEDLSIQSQQGAVFGALPAITNKPEDDEQQVTDKEIVGLPDESRYDSRLRTKWTRWSRQTSYANWVHVLSATDFEHFVQHCAEEGLCVEERTKTLTRVGAECVHEGCGCKAQWIRASQAIFHKNEHNHGPEQVRTFGECNGPPS